MKITQFYYNDFGDYDNFLEKLIQDVEEQFYGKGYTSINISRLINFFRQRLTKYVYIKFQKNVHVIVLLPKNDQPLIDRGLKNRQEEIRIYLSYDKVKALLNGSYKGYRQYLETLIDQINSTVQTEPTTDFNDYLVIELDNLAQLCAGELLQVYSKTFVNHSIKKSESWIKLSRQSSIFNDYFNYYKQDKQAHKMIFLKFLKTLLENVELGESAR